MDPAKPALTRVDRLQDGILLVIVLLTGLMAGAASFHHVHEFTINNSPKNTADWFGWANAVICELIPTACLIEIGRRRRHDPQASVRYPMALLVAAVAVSLTAQLAVAKPSVFGWMVSALPALAFFAVSKLVFSATAPPRPTHPVTALTPATSPAPSPDIPRAEVRPVAAAHEDQGHDRRHDSDTGDEDRTTDTGLEDHPPVTTEAVPAVTAAASALAPAAPVERFPAPLLANARTIAVSHRDSHGEDIKANQLAVRLRVPTPIAADILTHLTSPPAAANTTPHNGSTVAAHS
ncbi:hypothetical protein [Couchioplanes azureus]|uniref:hypothetical protein n=1 Tax=Couchioplanes caeruleus TaxID=56438 RepID=UPI001670AA31|nr:hypothetical protein [Couchioplanes caeruleus]